MKHHPKVYACCVVLALSAILVSCDFYHPKKSFRFAVPQSDYMYNYMYKHLKSLLERNGYEITVVYTDRNVDANRLVALGEADLAFVNNVSSHILDSLGEEAGILRTVIPLTKRALLGFSRTPTQGQNTSWNSLTFVRKPTCRPTNRSKS